MRAFIVATVLGCATLATTLFTPGPAEASWLSQALRGGYGYGHRPYYGYGGGYYGRGYYGGGGYYGGYYSQPYYSTPYYGYGAYRPYSGYYSAPYYGYGHGRNYCW